MASTAETFPSSATITTDGDTGWLVATTITAALAALDGNEAECPFEPGISQSDTLRPVFPAFSSIPAGATLNRVRCRIYGQSGSTLQNATYRVRDTGALYSMTGGFGSDAQSPAVDINLPTSAFTINGLRSGTTTIRVDISTDGTITDSEFIDTISLTIEYTAGNRRRKLQRRMRATRKRFGR